MTIDKVPKFPESISNRWEHWFHDRYKAVGFVFVFVLRYRLRPSSPVCPAVRMAHTLHREEKCAQNGTYSSGEEYVLCSCPSSVALTKSQKTPLNYGLFFDVLTVRRKPGISDGERIRV
jgi:hypothetical protein